MISIGIFKEYLEIDLNQCILLCPILSKIIIPEEQIGYAKQAIFVLTPNAPKWNDEYGNTLYKMIYIGKEAFGVLRHRDYPPEICLMENAKYFSWRAKLEYLTLREEHVVNHIVTLQEQ